MNTTDETISFENRHNFEVGEAVVYDARGNTPIVNVVSGSVYYVAPVNETKIKLHNKPEEAKVGINTVNIGNVSFGFHKLTTVKAKNTITKIYVKESGSGIQIEKLSSLQDLLTETFNLVLVHLTIIYWHTIITSTTERLLSILQQEQLIWSFNNHTVC